MTRYTICFDEEKEAHILRWMDEQANKGRSLKALVERSIAQEGYTDIFSLAWQRNIRSSTIMPDEPVADATGYNVPRSKKKRGRPKKNVSSSTASETNQKKQNEELMPIQSDRPQTTDTAPSSTENSEIIPVPETPAEPDREYISDKQSAVETANSTEVENDGYRRPGNVDLDMAKFL